MYENDRLKEELLANISDLFLTYGLRSTSMDDICTHLKISKKTLYQIFENKDHVVEQVMFYRLEKIRKETNEESISKKNPVRFLYSIKKHIIEDLNSRLPANYFDVKKYHPEVDKRIREAERKFIYSILSSVLRQGVEQGFFRKEADMEIQMYLFEKQMNFLKEQEMLNEIEYPIIMLISTIVDNFILSISTVEGVAVFDEISKNEKTKIKSDEK